MVAAAIIGGSALSAGIGASASKSAAGAQGASATASLENQMIQEAQSQNNLRPYMQAGNAGASWLQSNMQNGTLGGKFTGQDYLDNQDPGYGFQLNQGQQALQNSQAAQSGVLSGAALKGLIGYNQGMASTGYQNAYNRWLSQQQNTYGMMSGLMNTGEAAAAGAATTGVGYANGISGALTAQGNASASGTVGAANAINSGISNGSGYMYLNSLMNKPSSGGSAPTDASGYALSNYGAGGAADGVTPYL